MYFEVTLVRFVLLLVAPIAFQALCQQWLWLCFPSLLWKDENHPWNVARCCPRIVREFVI
jgi:hypothetical protein